ncbi:MAG: GLPGLI family protein [Cyclobacteriaceae bacterium]|nr:GLPGLI family protein [Cyclobacteriaceae bacterium]
MKRILILLGVLVSLAAAQVVFGQVTQGVITYETKINLHRRLPKEREEMKAMIPEFRTTKEQLFFRGSESLFKPLIEDEEEDIVGTAGGGTFQMRMRQPNTEVYMDQNETIFISKQEFMGKEYLIEDTLKMSPWKFGTETKTIQGYECKQAFFTEETQMMVMGPSGPVATPQQQEITAWYTDKLRPFLGPDRFNTLPGAVLAVDINNGERVIVAQKIETRELKKNELKKPTTGAKVTRAEYRKLVDEQMKNMGNRGMIIRN